MSALSGTLAERASARSQEFGLLGSVLLKELHRARNLSWLSNPDLSTVLASFEYHAAELRTISPLVCPAVSLLALEYPMHDLDPSGVVWHLATHAFSPLPQLPLDGDASYTSSPAKFSVFAHRLAKDGAFRESRYARKPHPAAASKPMVTLGALILACIKQMGAGRVGKFLGSLAHGTPEDVVVAALLYWVGLAPLLHHDSDRTALQVILQPDNAKGLSNALKALGCNATRLGAALTEGQTMQGRMCGSVNWDKDMGWRITPEGATASTMTASLDELRPHVRAVLRLELPNGWSMPDLDHFWSSRWSWCVNGSHTSTSSDVLGIPRDDTRPFGRMYRRMASEMLTSEPISGWSGKTTVSASEKLEHGKTRAIYACDTASYFAWSWPLNSVQKAWKNRRVLLDPGSGGMVSIASRVATASTRPGYNVMLDYEDFNSQHRTEVMQMVVDELFKLNPAAPVWLRDKLMASLDDEWVREKTTARTWRHIEGGLLSGHRGTTFFNSVLNGAYVSLAIGAETFAAVDSLHTGDDVYMRAPNLGVVTRLLLNTKATGCRFNPSKQSIGPVHAEFLRCGIGPGAAYGYLARSVASAASGSWTTLDALGPRESLLNAIATSRALINRSGSMAIGEVVGRSLRFNKICGSRRATVELVCGRASFEGSPVFGDFSEIRGYSLSNLVLPEIPPDSQGLQSHATKAYLQSHVAPVEVEALALVGADPVPAMVASSYSKWLNHAAEPERVQLRASRPRPVTRRGYVTRALLSEHVYGVLNKYPLIHFLRDRLSHDNLVTLLQFLGASTRDAYKTAFGAVGDSVAVVGAIPYSDAASIAAKGVYDKVYVSYPVYM